jgi:AraC-like DNA-binding protein
MLSRRTVLDSDGIILIDVACRQPRDRHDEATERPDGYGLVFVRRGCFARTADGNRVLLDPTVAYSIRPDQEESYDHPHSEGDDCTVIRLAPELLGWLSRGEGALPADLWATSPQTDLAHRTLLAASRRGEDPGQLVEHTINLVADALGDVESYQLLPGRPTTAAAHRALANEVRESLDAELGISLLQLARQLAVSPHHLSRVFRAVTGNTISRHRMRLRARNALERLAAGEDDLAHLAAHLGFTDQSHLCRVIRAETGSTPAALRRVLS